MSNDATTKNWLFERSKAEAAGFGLEVVEAQSSADKPWGAYLRISESSYEAFRKAYWGGIDVPTPGQGLRLDPKILIVAPNARLSLQYHGRRSEHWRVLDGPVKIAIGNDGASMSDIIAEVGQVVRIPCGQWHRLVGLNTWGRVAEIWEHTDQSKPSGEDDIVRVEDDYGR